jgi:hypothetical protein
MSVHLRHYRCTPPACPCRPEGDTPPCGWSCRAAWLLELRGPLGSSRQGLDGSEAVARDPGSGGGRRGAGPVGVRAHSGCLGGHRGRRDGERGRCRGDRRPGAAGRGAAGHPDAGRRRAHRPARAAGDAGAAGGGDADDVRRRRIHPDRVELRCRRLSAQGHRAGAVGPSGAYPGRGRGGALPQGVADTAARPPRHRGGRRRGGGPRPAAHLPGTRRPRPGGGRAVERRYRGARPPGCRHGEGPRQRDPHEAAGDESGAGRAAGAAGRTARQAAASC